MWTCFFGWLLPLLDPQNNLQNSQNPKSIPQKWSRSTSNMWNCVLSSPRWNKKSKEIIFKRLAWLKKSKNPPNKWDPPCFTPIKTGGAPTAGRNLPCKLVRLAGEWTPFGLAAEKCCTTELPNICPRKLQHTPRAHPRQSPLPTMKGIPL